MQLSLPEQPTRLTPGINICQFGVCFAVVMLSIAPCGRVIAAGGSQTTRSSLSAAVDQDGTEAVESHQSPSKPISRNFFVAPVTTEFQMSQFSGENIVAYASIDVSSVIDPDTKQAIASRFDFDGFCKSLANVRRQTDDGTLCLRADFLDARCGPDTRKNIERDLRSIATDAGFETVRYTSRYTNAKYKWYGLPQATDDLQDEPQLGNDVVGVFPVRTPFGRFLAGKGTNALKDCDCFIEITDSLPMDRRRILTGANKGVIRNALRKMTVPKNASAVLRVSIESPGDRDALRNLPQTKQDSEFHRDAIQFLKLMGFTKTKVEVVIDNTRFDSEYE